jgi:hypothetical protein
MRGEKKAEKIILIREHSSLYASLNFVNVVKLKWLRM